MSLILKAFPMAFLISPDTESKIPEKNFELKLENETLQLIKVATNLNVIEINSLMANTDIPCKLNKDIYTFENGLSLQWKLYNGFYCAFLSYHHNSASELVKKGEELMKTFEIILKRNIRDIDSKEYFYYCYKTNFMQKKEVLELLKENNIENISKLTEREIRFRVNNKNYKYIRKNKQENYYLETEQKISLMNIIPGQKIYSSKTIKTNIVDKSALLKTLQEYGATDIENDDYNISCNMFGMEFLYSKNNTQDSYNLEINKISDKENCSKILEELDDEYCLNVQDMTYRKIMERIRNKNLMLESEEVSDDDSIILTINVGL